MLVQVAYDRAKAADYARTWALSRNPRYLNFEKLGGDCTNFASQCIFAGSGVMNHAAKNSWYYYSGYKKSPSWTGVPYLYNFLIHNDGVGPFAEETYAAGVEIGDIVQLGDEAGRFYHSPVVTAVMATQILVCAHTFDAYMRPLSTYSYHTVRYIHIAGVRKYQP